MGGGGAMRAVSKVAGIGTVINGGLRGAPAVPPVEQSVRNSSIPVTTILSSSSNGVRAAAADQTQRQVCELEDWEFAGGEEELEMVAGEPMPRVVFGGVPSFQEAKEATVELKDALDKVYLASPKSSASGDLVADDQVSSLPLISKPDSEASLVVETTESSSIPNNALKAFKLLSGSPAVQDVVASITSDPNVWSAVSKNSALNDFIESNRMIALFQGPMSPEKVEASSAGSQSGDSGNWFSDVMKSIKVTAVDLVNNCSSFLDNIFGQSSDVKGDGKASSMDMMTFGAASSFMGLAVLVAMVVLLKRA
ncbi:hypothetical protein UlMin_003421 [Ulmus minor]